MESIKENVIEWLTGSETITVTLSQKKYITKVKKLAEQSEKVQIIAENADGSIVAHLPLEMLSLRQKRSVHEEQKKALAERLAQMRAKKNES